MISSANCAVKIKRCTDIYQFLMGCVGADVTDGDALIWAAAVLPSQYFCPYRSIFDVITPGVPLNVPAHLITLNMPEKTY